MDADASGALDFNEFTGLMRNLQVRLVPLASPGMGSDGASAERVERLS